MAGDAVGHATGCCAYAGNQRSGRPGDTAEGLRIGRIRAGERTPNSVNLNGRFIKSESSGGRSSRAVIVDLPQDATGRVEMSIRILRDPSRIRTLERIVNSIVGGTVPSLPGAISERRIDWQAMLRGDIRHIEKRYERQPGIAVDNRENLMRGVVCHFVGAVISAIGSGACFAVPGGDAGSDAQRTVIVGRNACRYGLHHSGCSGRMLGKRSE